MNVFPPRDLPGTAEEWGRAVESRIEGLDGSITALSQTCENNGRFTGGQLAVFGNQVQEQYDRTTIRQAVPDLSVTGSGTSEPFPRATTNFSVTAPSGGRIAQVEAYMRHANTNFGDVGVHAYLSYGGSILSRVLWDFDTDDLLVISATPRMGYAIGTIQLPEDGVANFSLTCVRVGFTGGTTTETLTDIEVFLTPYQKTL